MVVVGVVKHVRKRSRYECARLLANTHTTPRRKKQNDYQIEHELFTPRTKPHSLVRSLIRTLQTSTPCIFYFSLFRVETVAFWHFYVRSSRFKFMPWLISWVVYGVRTPLATHASEFLYVLEEEKRKQKTRVQMMIVNFHSLHLCICTTMWHYPMSHIKTEPSNRHTTCIKNNNNNNDFPSNCNRLSPNRAK